jgi:predicted O-linked N-acetylglucosamine transferase (SPINDLY family)
MQPSNRFIGCAHKNFGIDPQRIEFLPMTLDDAQDRGRYAALDVALDAFPTPAAILPPARWQAFHS